MSSKAAKKLGSLNNGYNIPDSLIPPNSTVRGVGGTEANEKSGIVINNKSSAENGLKRIKPAPGWGSNANGQYDPSPPAVPNF